LLSIHDTGIGMEEETRRRVFEPFFTTQMNVGTGLGLSTAYRTVQNWGGSISVESAPNKGTTFVLNLPAWDKPAAIRPNDKIETPKRKGHVLVVEDEVIINRVITQALATNYSVETTFTGPEALDQFTSGAFDAALIDLGLPGVPGDKIVAQLKTQDPTLVTLMITGWPIEENDPRLIPFDFLLHKPVDVHTLQQTIAQAIALRDSRTGSLKP
jgi:two-component system cell cycle sensor histidine kinase/response regulator CckA